jgi:hypothetical protein
VRGLLLSGMNETARGVQGSVLRTGGFLPLQYWLGTYTDHRNNLSSEKKNPLFQSDFLGLSQLTNETGLELATHVL